MVDMIDPKINFRLEIRNFRSNQQ